MTESTRDETAPLAANGSCSDRMWKAGLVAILLIYTLLRWSLLAIPFVRDEGFYGVAAQTLLRGGVMYRDVFDHKPPGIFWIYKLALTIFPATPTGLHIFLHLWNLITLGLIISIGRTLGGRVAGLWAGWIFAIYSSGAAIDGHIASPELFMLLPIAGSLRLALSGLEFSNNPSAPKYAAPLMWAASGISGAAACWIKQPAALQLLVIPLYLIGTARKKGILPAAKMYACWLAGGIVLSLLICVAFRDNFGEFMRWSFVQSSEYFATLWDDNWWNNLSGQLKKWGADQAFPLAVCAIGLAAGIQKKSGLAWLGLALFVFSSAGAIQNGYTCGHYFALTMLPIALIAGLTLGVITARLQTRSPAWIAGLVFISAVPLAWAAPNYTFYPLWDAEFYAAEYLRTRSTPDDSVFVCGQEPQLMFLAQRKSANPYIDLIALSRNTRRHREFQHHAWECIDTAKPLYMIISYQSSHWRGAPGVDPFFRNQCDALQRDHYRLESILIYDNAAKEFHFVHGYDEAPRESKVLVRLLEFWRRTDRPADKNDLK